MSLRRGIYGLVGIYVALFAILTAAVVDTVAEREAAVREARTRIQPARQLVDELSSGMIVHESSLRGYLLTRDESFVAGFDEGTQRLAQIRADLGTLLGPTYTPIVDLVVHTSERWELTVADPELRLAREGRWDEAAEIVQTNTGRRRFAVAQREIDHLRSNLTDRQAELDDATLIARQRLTTLAYVATTMAIGLAIGAALLLRRFLTAPLDHISAAVDRVVSGALHEPIPVTGPQELARLAAQVEQMRATTVGHLDRAEQAIEGLEQQGPAVVLLRKELAPAPLPQPDGIALAAVTQPAQGAMAGDWYDISVRGDGVVVVALVDVAGHDVQAGILALRAKHLLQAAIADRRSPDAALHWLARMIGDTGERFITCVVVELDAAVGTARYAAAGHPPPMLVDRSGEVVELDPTGPLLGPLPGAWGCRDLALPAGWVLLLYTDGLVEIRSEAGTFDATDLARALHEHAGRTPDAIVAGCLARARARAGGRFTDDVSIIALAPRAAAGRTPRPPRPARAAVSSSPTS